MAVTFEVLLAVEVDAVSREEALRQARELDPTVIVLESKRVTDATE